MNGELKTIKLHGRLATEFGPEFRLAVLTPAEAVRALIMQLPKFRDAISEGNWVVVRGEDPDTGFAFDRECLTMNLGKAPLHIMPAAMGAGHGVGKILVGVVLVAVAVLSYGTAAPEEAGFLGGVGLTAAQVGGIGAALVLSGISSLLAPTAKTNLANSPAQNPSYIFSGPENTAVEGSCVPLVYGEVLVGSVVGAVSMTVADYGNGVNNLPPPGAAVAKTGIQLGIHVS